VELEAQKLSYKRASSRHTALSAAAPAFHHPSDSPFSLATLSYLLFSYPLNLYSIFTLLPQVGLLAVEESDEPTLFSFFFSRRLRVSSLGDEMA